VHGVAQIVAPQLLRSLLLTQAVPHGW
jgi:hypothetical protein